jgi:anion-transporting  ArsA/GET3 family ATPase
MLQAPSTAFLIVTSAAAETIDEAIWFRRTLAQTGFPFAGVVVNRVHHDMLGDRELPAVQEALTGLLDPSLAQRVAENFADYHVLARRDERNIARLAGEIEDAPLFLVPQLDGDVHDVDGLLRVHRYLFASDEERARMIADVVA